MSGSKKFGWILLAAGVLLLAFGFVQWNTLMENHTQLLIKGDLKAGVADIWLSSAEGMIPLLFILAALGGSLCVVALGFICGDLKIIDRKARPEGRTDAIGSTDS